MSSTSTNTTPTSTSTWRSTRSEIKRQIMDRKDVKSKLSPASVVDLTFKFYAYQVLQGDEVEQSFTTANYIELRWDDMDLTWDIREHPETPFIAFDYDDLWHPELLVTNSAKDDFSLIRPMSQKLIVFYNGTVSLSTPAMLRTTCSLDLTHYPFDVQNCEIIFIPYFDECNFTLRIIEIDSMPDPFRLTGEWNIIRRHITTEVYMPAKLKIRRSSLFYVVSVIVPMVITSLTTSCVFLIPPASGEKVSFLVTLFVSNAVFLNYIATTMPRTMSLDNLPRLSLFLVVGLMESFFALIATIFVMRKYRQEQELKKKRALNQHGSNIQYTNTSNNNGNGHVMRDPLSEREANDKHNKSTRESSGTKANEGVQNQEMFMKRNRVLPLENPNKTELEKDHKKSPERKGCGITWTQWDMVFFILYHVTSMPFYVLLFI
ncbi:neuronal acetylcholine receptor subunit alpha-3-like [Physella acuta]|uniref:neuronal acetylcholine receptor subunit alpha-3-like n=1 Tax=Physella acuta TaxID=109671 RepID=UPI0027DCF0E4|nr:neuronal acetylcholine receptor subunit alpha-3-like [Physella acuta]